MLESFEAAIEQQKLLQPNQTYVVAVSGGLDSVVLLDLLTRLQKSWGWDLVVAHLDHAVRPESYQDAAFVGALADKHGQRFMVHRLQSKSDPKSNTEAALRQARHKWLKKVRRQVDGVGVITAHHQNDRLETAIWHAIRGADRHGLTSLQSRSGEMIRPLINFSRGEILHYANLQDLQWREDATNADFKFTRNLIRHELVALAPQIDAHFHQNLNQWLDHLDTINIRLDNNLDLLLEQIGRPNESGWGINRAKYSGLSDNVRQAVLEHLARKLTAGRGLTRSNLLVADKWLRAAPTGSFTEALPGLLLVREYDNVNFVPRSRLAGPTPPTSSQALVDGQPLNFGRFRLTLVPAEDAHPDLPVLSPGVYFVRQWAPGDRVQPVGMSGSKKVQDVFVDRKIPRQQRAAWPLVVSADNDIVLIPGLVRDRRFTTTLDSTARALQVEELPQTYAQTNTT